MSATLAGLWETYLAYSAVVDRVAELGVTWTNIPRPTNREGNSGGSLTEHVEHLAWGAEVVMPLFRD